MAAGSTDRPVVIPSCSHYLEVTKLKLAREHFPLSVSLREQILSIHSPDSMSGGDLHAQLEQLVAGLAACNDPELPLLEALERHLATQGQNASPDSEQQSILMWLDQAQRDWVDRYPLATQLADTLLRIRPLVAAQALTDPEFMRPGAHPLHKLLDQAVTVSIGWEPDVARSESVKQLVTNAVENALTWFDNREVDLTAVCEAFERDSERERTRAARMARRSVEAEEGRTRSEHARRVAAELINGCLADNPLPPVMGELLKGSWYSSAQLVLLKFGERSRQWEAMSETTRNLLYSLQPIDAASQENKQQVFEIVASIPRELKRWLLSLHHDDEALENAVGLVEFAHLKVLRQQDVEAETVPPIDTGERDISPSEHAEKLGAIAPGQWFMIRQGEAPPRRLKLSLNLARDEQLLFTDHAGLKALQLSYADFESLLSLRQVKKLAYEVSFSGALAHAAGIDSVETLQQFMESTESAKSTQPELAMGTWLGFHDGETPLLARVAVHDPQRNMYILVDREGIKIREIERQDLQALMEQGLVEILEGKSSFKAQLDQVLEQQSDPGQEE